MLRIVNHAEKWMEERLLVDSYTILLGAVGSGLWELTLRPGGYWIGHTVLTAATLASKFLRDQVYLEAAKHSHEAVAEHVSSVLGAIWGAIFGVSISYILFSFPGTFGRSKEPLIRF